MTDTAGEFRIVVLFAVFEAERLKSRWFGVDVVSRAIEHLPKNRAAPDSLSARTTRPLPILVLRYAAERFIVTAPPVVGWVAERVVTSPSSTLWTRAHSASGLFRVNHGVSRNARFRSW